MLNEDHSQPKIFGAVVVKPELKIPLTQVIGALFRAYDV